MCCWILENWYNLSWHHDLTRYELAQKMYVITSNIITNLLLIIKPFIIRKYALIKFVMVITNAYLRNVSCCTFKYFL